MGEENQYAEFDFSDREAFKEGYENAVEIAENIIELKKDPKFQSFIKHFVTDFQEKELKRAHLVKGDNKDTYMMYLQSRAILISKLDNADEALKDAKLQLAMLAELDDKESGNDSEEHA